MYRNGPLPIFCGPSTIALRRARVHILTVAGNVPLAREHEARAQRRMVEHRLGSCVVRRHGKLAGIFSTVDACRVLAEVLAERFPRGPSDAA